MVSMSVSLYLRHDVYERMGDGDVIVYRCLELIPGGGFVVQSADRMRGGDGHEQQFLELMSESAPEERAAPCASLVEAIAKFREEFGI
ncbi:hypothetical protein MFUL124B02_04595 [Myxococcus fulvus 124B02]|nr:hypothetical protein MFUL124B02_04595 [Myxococcus fulvus 124B02]